jgi:dipeptidyl aminopeptidase/acylaminoacyl peptidase
MNQEFEFSHGRLSMHRNQHLITASVLFVFITTALMAQESFTLKSVMSSPFPSDLTASPRGEKIAWVFNAEGKRNIWIAEAPEFKGRQLTRYTEDDGQEITDLAFSPDGLLIAYVRGGPKNSSGDYPNPTSDPEGVRQEVWIASLSDGNTWKLAEGTSPLFSPSGEIVIFSREDQLWSLPTSGGTEHKLFDIRGRVSSPSWSPDGSQLTFISARGDHSFVAVYEPHTDQLRFIEPSTDRDIEPRWSPDGKRIAFIRLFNVRDTYSKDHERVTPWSIRLVDLQTGQEKEVWKSDTTEMESFSRQLFGESILQWGLGDRLVFGSERSGWAHLYSISVNGGEITELTPGNYEVENVAWSPDRSFVVVASNAGDIDRRHLWKVDIASGKREQITSGNSIEMSPAILGRGDLIAFVRSTAKDPLVPYISLVNGSKMRQVAPDALPADFPSSRLVEPEQVIFKAADGLEIHGQVFKPKNASGRLPAIIFMHGGPPRQMLLGWHYMYYYHNAYAFNQYLANRGSMVLSVNYRSGIGYGRTFREAQHRGARGASEYQDIIAAGLYLCSRTDVDGKRIGLWGGSYGGYLTALGLARNSDLFAAGVDLHGVHDWSVFRRFNLGPQGGGDAVRIARESSPVASVDTWRSPVLLIHGDDDRNVDFSQTVDLVRLLRERGVTFEELIFPDEVHDFLLHRSWLQAYEAADGFFQRYLK